MNLWRRLVGLCVFVGMVAAAALPFAGSVHRGYAAVDPCAYQESQLRMANSQLQRAQQNVEAAQNRLMRTQDSVATNNANTQGRIASAQSSAAMIRANASASVCINFNIFGAVRCAAQMAARRAAANRRADAMVAAAIRRYNIAVQSGNLRIERDAKRLALAEAAYKQSQDDYNTKYQALLQCQAQPPATPTPLPSATPTRTATPTPTPRA